MNFERPISSLNTKEMEDVIHELLIENKMLVDVILDNLKKDRLQEGIAYQQWLHRNLWYIAMLSNDRHGLTMMQTLPPVGGSLLSEAAINSYLQSANAQMSQFDHSSVLQGLAQNLNHYQALYGVNNNYQVPSSYYQTQMPPPPPYVPQNVPQNIPHAHLTQREVPPYYPYGYVPNTQMPAGANDYAAASPIDLATYQQQQPESYENRANQPSNSGIHYDNPDHLYYRQNLQN